MIINPYMFGVAPETGPLASHLTNTDSGYSLIQLRSNYAGACLRVRRASDDAEQDIGFSGGVMDSASLATFCSGTDGFVTTWYDQFTAANNLVQTTDGYQPKIVSSGSVLPDILFDGIDDYMVQAGNCSASAGLTTFLAGRLRSTTGTGYSSSRSDYGGITLASSGGWAGAVAGCNTGFKVFNGTLDIASQPNATYVTWCNPSLGLSSGLKFYVNGVDKTSASSSGTTSGTFAATPTYLGCKSDVTSFGRLAVRSFVTYKAALTSGDVASISTILRPALTADLLSSFTTNLWSVCSASRRVRSSYAGSSFRVRRASDNTEQDIGFTAGGLIDDAALATFCAGTNGFIRTWYDQSGNGNDWGNPTAANQPKIYDSATGRIPEGAIFDGSNDSIFTANNSGTPTAFTVYLRGTSNTTSGGYFEHSTNFNSNNSPVNYWDSGAMAVGTHGTSGNGYARSYFNAPPQMRTMGACFRFDRAQASEANVSTYLLGGKLITRSSTDSSGTKPAGNFDARAWYLFSRAGSSFFNAAQADEFAIYETAHSDATANEVTYRLGG